MDSLIVGKLDIDWAMMNYRPNSVEIFCGLIDDMEVEVTMHISEYGHDGGPRLIFTPPEEKEYAQFLFDNISLRGDNRVLEPLTTLNISITDANELDCLIRGLTVALEYFRTWESLKPSEYSYNNPDQP